MPTREQLRAALALATSPVEIEFFYSQLTTVAWVPLLAQEGMLDHPPEPVVVDDGVMFPSWPASRYLVRVADQDPDLVGDVLMRFVSTNNPRVWMDIVEALTKMPTDRAAPFLPFIATWVHHPNRLLTDTLASKLAFQIVEADLRADALAIVGTLAQILKPRDLIEEDSWIPLDRHDYADWVPKLAVALARFGTSAVQPLVGELTASLEAKYGPAEEGHRNDYSSIWRPAIEDHEQNWDYDLEASLVVAIRDGLVAALRREPESTARVADELLASEWPIVRRIGMHLLVEFGERAVESVAATLGRVELFADDTHRHELHRLVRSRIGLLSTDQRASLEEAVRTVARQQVTDEDPDRDRRRAWYLRRWLAAADGHLSAAAAAELEELNVSLPPDPHPDFPNYHTSWIGPTSPIDETELRTLGATGVLNFLRSWQPGENFGPVPSALGLARALASVVAESPASYADTAPEYISLRPDYAAGLLQGLRKAAKERSFAWEPVLDLAQRIVEMPVEPLPEDPDDQTWTAVRRDVARLIETGLTEGAAEMPEELRSRVWPVLEPLLDDADPTPEAEAQFGPPNMDPLTYSLNTTRGSAFHAAFAYVIWCLRAEGEDGHTIAGVAPEAASALSDRLEPGRDPSVAVRAAYGWWTPDLVHHDPAWIRAHSDALFGELKEPLHLAAWHAYLAHGAGLPSAFQALSDKYQLYAERLAELDAKPPDRVAVMSPSQRLIDHILRQWMLAKIEIVGGPFEVLLRSAKGWLVSEVVHQIGYDVYRARSISSDADARLQELWTYTRDAAQATGPDFAVQTLGGFGWWFASQLSLSWTLPELVALLEQGVRVDAEFEVIPRLAGATNEDPATLLRALDRLTADGAQRWELRSLEDSIRTILEAVLASDDPILRARAETLANRLGTYGMHSLGELLGPQGP